MTAFPTDALARVLDDVEDELLARWPETRIDPDLDRITRLLALLGDPQRSFRSVHLTGTNGKTSTARMVEALLAADGSRTGRFTSPHLTSIVERISLDQHPIDVGRLLRTYEAVRGEAERVDAIGPHPVSFFEMTVAMAYAAFARHGTEVAVVEVGMGGRWDATNVIDAEVATILPIALDHTDYLGGTIREIAAEKAGIIKPGAVAVSARQTDDALAVLRRRTDEQGAAIVLEGSDFAVTHRSATPGGQVVSVAGLHGRYDALPLALHGAHQAQNAAVAIASVEALRGEPLDPAAVHTALRHVASPGRFEIRPGTPPVILDAAHNPHGARTLAACLAESPAGTTVAVVAVMADKDHESVLRELAPVVDHVVCVRSSSPRCLRAEDLARSAAGVFGGQHRVDVAPDVLAGLAAARRILAGADRGRIVVTGSVVTVGDAAAALPTAPPSRPH